MSNLWYVGRIDGEVYSLNVLFTTCTVLNFMSPDLFVGQLERMFYFLCNNMEENWTRGIPQSFFKGYDW